MRRKKQVAVVSNNDLPRPISEIEALCRSGIQQLADVFEGNVGDSPTLLQKILLKQAEQALEGNGKAQDRVMNTWNKLCEIGIPAAAIQPQPANVINQAVLVQDGRPTDVLLEIRKQIIHLVRWQGPIKTERIAEAVSLPVGTVLAALDHPKWFEMEADGWHITNSARSEVIDAVHAQARHITFQQ